ncbi:MAG TPA: hypothetical protein VH559_10225 [Gemmatimonadaceae bacterium]|jgi:hypothetical protein
MRLIPIRAAEAVDAPLIAQVKQAFQECYTLAELLTWAARQSPRVHVAEIVTQDEYTHDIVLPYSTIYLSFDTT